jgi:hypothetical protein
MTDVINWNTLTPDERNRIVAEKVMGWQEKECEGQWIGYGYDYGMKWEDDNYYICNVCEAKTYRPTGGEHKQDLILPYSTDMNAAMTIVNKWIMQGRVVFECKLLSEFHMNIYTATFIRDDGSQVQSSNTRSTEAICVTSLRAQGCEVKL